jgi:hypothetical protein
MPRAKSRKPLFGSTVDRTNRIAQKLAAGLLFNEAGGSQYFDICGINNLVVTGTNPTWSVGPHGPAITMDANSDLNYIRNIGAMEQFGKGSFAISCWYKTSNAATHNYFVSRDNNGSGTRHIIWLCADASGNYTFILSDGAVNDWWQGAGPFHLNDGYWHNLVAVRKLGVSLTLYVDGVLFVTTSSSTGDVSFTAGDDSYRRTLIGNSLEAASNFVGSMGSLLFFNDELAASEVQSLYANPYQIIKQSGPMITGAVVTTVTGTLSGDLDRITGSLSGNRGVSGTAAGLLDILTGTITGNYGVTGTIVGSLDQVTGAFAGSHVYTGTVSGVLQRTTGQFSGAAYQQVTGTVSGSLDSVTGTFVGFMDISGVLAGGLDRLTGNIRGRSGTLSSKNLLIEIDIGV